MTQIEAEVANLFALHPRTQLLAALRRHFSDEVAFNEAVRAQPTQKESDDEWLTELEVFCVAELPKDKKRRAPVPHEYVIRMIREVQVATRVAKQFHGECVDLKRERDAALWDTR